jgi:hypothetical protein
VSLQATAGNAAVASLLAQLKRPANAHAACDCLPVAGGSEEEVDDTPSGQTLQRTGDGPTVQREDSCEQPRDMSKVTSGPFRNGLSITDYFPDLASRGYPAAAGPFDTGTWVGSNVQLVGTIPSPCRPELFTLAQTVTYDRRRLNGVTAPDEGQTKDDIAKSGRDATSPPFRQEWLGDPPGYNISMADPPAVRYPSVRDYELDRSFVTSLVGPGGRATVNWATSIRIAGGTVTRNTLT